MLFVQFNIRAKDTGTSVCLITWQVSLVLLYQSELLTASDLYHKTMIARWNVTEMFVELYSVFYVNFDISTDLKFKWKSSLREIRGIKNCIRSDRELNNQYI